MKDSLPSTRKDFIRRPLPQGSGRLGRRDLLLQMCLFAWPPKGAALKPYVAQLSFPETPGLVSRGERRQTVAALQAAQMREATSVLRPAPNILPTTLENSHAGYTSLKTFATKCSKRPVANPTL